MKLLQVGFSLALVIGLVALIGVVAGLPVGQVECLVGSTACPTEVMTPIQSLTQHRFFVTDLEVKVHEQVSTIPGYTLVSFERRLPSTVVVHLRQNRSLYQLRTAGAAEAKVVDSEGYQYTGDSDKSLPTVVTTQSEWSAERHTQMVSLLEALAAERIEFSQIELTTTTSGVVILNDQTTAVVDVTAPARDIKKLAVVLSGIEPSALEGIQEIDVRYRLPVLRQHRSIPRHSS